jgi:hypothetical protein
MTTMVVTLTRPRYNPTTETLTFTATPLPNVGTPNVTTGTRLGKTSVFIDNSADEGFSVTASNSTISTWTNAYIVITNNMGVTLPTGYTFTINFVSPPPAGATFINNGTSSSNITATTSYSGGVLTVTPTQDMPAGDTILLSTGFPASDGLLAIASCQIVASQCNGGPAG